MNNGINIFTHCATTTSNYFQNIFITLDITRNFKSTFLGGKSLEYYFLLFHLLIVLYKLNNAEL